MTAKKKPPPKKKAVRLTAAQRAEAERQAHLDETERAAERQRQAAQQEEEPVPATPVSKITRDLIPPDIARYIPESIEGEDLAVLGFRLVAMREDLLAERVSAEMQEVAEIVVRQVDAVKAELQAVSDLSNQNTAQIIRILQVIAQTVQRPPCPGTGQPGTGATGTGAPRRPALPAAGQPAAAQGIDPAAADPAAGADPSAEDRGPEGAAPERVATGQEVDLDGHIIPLLISDEVALGKDDLEKVYRMALEVLPPNAPVQKAIEEVQRMVAGYHLSGGRWVRGDPWGHLPDMIGDILVKRLQIAGFIPRNPEAEPDMGREVDGI